MRWSQYRPLAHKCVSPNAHARPSPSNCDGFPCRRVNGGGGGGGRGRGCSADEVATDAHFGLDDGAAAEDDVLGAMELGFAGDFVAGVGFDVVGFWFGGGHACWGVPGELQWGTHVEAGEEKRCGPDGVVQ